MLPFRKINIPMLIYQIGRPNYMVNSSYRLNNLFKFILALLSPFISIWDKYNTQRIRAYKVAQCEYGIKQVEDILNDLYDPDPNNPTPDPDYTGDYRRIKCHNTTDNLYFYSESYTPDNPKYVNPIGKTPPIYVYNYTITTNVIIEYPKELENDIKSFSNFMQTVDSLVIWGIKYELKAI